MVIVFSVKLNTFILDTTIDKNSSTNRFQEYFWTRLVPEDDSTKLGNIFPNVEILHKF